MSIVLYSTTLGTGEYITISHNKGSTLYYLRITNSYKQIIKKGDYLTMKSAKQAIKRYIKQAYN